MLTAALLFALVAPVQDRVPEITLGPRTGAITEPFSDAMGMAEMSDGRVIVSDRVEAVFSLADFRSGSRRTIGRNGSGPNEYQAFSLSVGVLPDAGTTVTLPTAQTYTDGTVVKWDEKSVEGQAEPEHPAPSFVTTAKDAEPAAHAHPDGAGRDDAGDGLPEHVLLQRVLDEAHVRPQCLGRVLDVR